MEPPRSKQQKPISRKRKQEQMQGRRRRRIDGKVGIKRKHWSDDNGGIDEFPDDILINILSHMSIKEACRASVLARRWRYLWTFCHGTLRFDNRDNVTGNLTEWEKFDSSVNAVLELNRAQRIEGLAICIDADKIHRNPIAARLHDWVDFAMRKGVERFELNLPSVGLYLFSWVERLILYSRGGITTPFCRLITLRLDHVFIFDQVVDYILAMCPNLEELCIRCSAFTKDLRVVDPPRLRVLEVSGCERMESLEVSAPNLVSLSYGEKVNILNSYGEKVDILKSENILKLKSVPNLRELSISGDFCLSLVMKPEEHMSYSDQLEKLVLDFQLQRHAIAYLKAPSQLPQLSSLKRLEVRVFTTIHNKLSYILALLEACPHLREIRIEVFHLAWFAGIVPGGISCLRRPFPIVQAQAAKIRFRRMIKVVEIAGYIGCSGDDALVLALMKIGRGSIERVVIDTQSAYYDDPLLDRHMRACGSSLHTYLAESRSMWPARRRGYRMGATTRNEARKIAQELVSKFPRRIKSTVT